MPKQSKERTNGEIFLWEKLKITKFFILLSKAQINIPLTWLK